MSVHANIGTMENRPLHSIEPHLLIQQATPYRRAIKAMDHLLTSLRWWHSFPCLNNALCLIYFPWTVKLNKYIKFDHANKKMGALPNFQCTRFLWSREWPPKVRLINEHGLLLGPTLRSIGGLVLASGKGASIYPKSRAMAVGKHRTLAHKDRDQCDYAWCVEQTPLVDGSSTQAAQKGQAHSKRFVNTKIINN